MRTNITRLFSCLLFLVIPISSSLEAVPESAFVNFETPPVHPLDLSPDGQTLCAVNLPDYRLEVFDLSTGTPVANDSVTVGVDPVTVRFRTDNEVWVVNHVSDSISIVDLQTMAVVATVHTDDEPCDVVFAGTPEKAFVSCSQVNKIQVFDPSNLETPPIEIPIDAEDPRSLAVSPDGTQVYAAIFESGNGSTILGGGSEGPGVISFPPNVVSDPAGPYGGTNPPPNDGAGFTPAISPAPTPPPVGLIVKKDASGRWMDDNGGDWSDLVSGASATLSGRPVGWDLPDRDIAVMDVASATLVGYVTGLANICMSLTVHPTSGRLCLVGTDGLNEKRFEPNINGKFLRVEFATSDPAGTVKSVTDLNAHLIPYSASQVVVTERNKSIGDPRGIVWNASGTKAYVTGMGSNNVIVVNASGTRIGLAPTIEVGEGPTGVVVDGSRNRVYVLNRFESSLSVISTSTETEVARIPFFDPTPTSIKVGRRHLYSTHDTSGLGHIACAACHIDSRMDRLAWDLGDPSGAMKLVDSTDRNLFPDSGGFQDYHPMKGPMTTQTLQDIIGHEPYQ